MALEIEQQRSLINSSPPSSELMKQIETSNRAIDKGIVMLLSNEAKLRANIFLLIANGILCIFFTGCYFWMKRGK
jgi:uncharacterized iron-regulated membrane protein